jgi:hypothetical protein
MNTVSLRQLSAVFVIFCLTGNAHAEVSPRHATKSKPEYVPHCSADEKPVFSCPVKGQKLVSACATKDLSDKTGSLIYRFGKKNQPEIMLSKSEEGWRDTVRAGNVMYAGGGGKYLGFKSNDYTYVVYSAVGRGWGTKQGLMVMKDEKEFRVHRCVREPYSRLSLDLFEKTGLKVEDNEIELPMP